MMSNSSFRLVGALALAFALALGAASAQVSPEVARERLAARGIEFSDEAFLRYAANGDTERLRLFLDAGVEIESRDPAGKTALAQVEAALFASFYESAGQVGERGVIELLVEGLSDDKLLRILNMKDPQGRTALMNAARRNRGGNIRKLVDLGADLTARDRTGETALHHAARYGNRDAASAILEKLWESERDPAKRSEFLSFENKSEKTALGLAKKNVRKPPDRAKLESYAGMVRRLKQAANEAAG